LSSCIVVIILTLAAFTPPIFAGDADTVYSATLENGIKVIVREGHDINLAAVDIWVRAGSVNETDATSGVSHFTEHMIFKSTDKFGPGRLDREAEGMGAELNGGTSRDWVHFYTTVASEYLPATLAMLGDAITGARFLPDDIERERRVVLDEIAKEESNPSARAMDAFARTAYTTHPYRLPLTGTKESVARLLRSDMVDYYNKYYTPQNITVAIAGDVSQEDAAKMVRAAFSGMKSSPSSAVREEASKEPATTEPKVNHAKSATSQAYVVTGYMGPSASDFKDACAMDVILVILGDTQSGRLSAAFAGAGVRFGKISSDFTTQKYPSTISVLAATSPGAVDAAAGVILKEFKRLAEEPVSDAELASAKRIVEGGDLFDQEVYSGQARLLGIYDMVGTFDMSLRYASTVRSLSSQDIREAAKKYFKKGGEIRLVMEPDKVNP
jgi:zinc protease